MYVRKSDEAASPPACLIVPAAGYGTRMRDITGGAPKELLPVRGLPAIYYAVLEGRSAGIDHVIIIIREGKESIRRCFLDPDYVASHFPGAEPLCRCFRERLHLTFLYQNDPRGECDALSYARDHIGACAALVIYPDNVALPASTAGSMLLSCYLEYGADVVGMKRATDAATPDSGGRIRIDPLGSDIFRIVDFCAKGGHASNCSSEYRSTGMYVASPWFFEFIAAARARFPQEEVTDDKVRRLMLDAGHVFYGLRLPGSVCDVGTPQGYSRCIAGESRSASYREGKNG